MMKLRLVSLANAAIVLGIGVAHVASAQSWVAIQPSSPPPSGRMNNTAVFDTNSDRLIIFGGQSTDKPSPLANDVWVLTHANRRGASRYWVNITPTTSDAPAPAARAAASAVYNAIKNEMLVFGGQVNGFSSNEVWILSNANGMAGQASWRSVTPSNSDLAPAPRQNHQAFYNATYDRMIVFGGLSNTTGTPQYLNDVWILEGAFNSLTPAWRPAQIQGEAAPDVRAGSAGAYVYDANKEQLLVVGGCAYVAGSGFSCVQGYNDVWRLSNVGTPLGSGSSWAWTKIADFSLTNNRPSAVGQYASAGYDSSSNRLYVFGGRLATPATADPAKPFGTFTSETWVLTNANGSGGNPSWAQVSSGTNVPAPRGQSVPPGLYDDATSKFMIFGGPGLNDTWTLLTH